MSYLATILSIILLLTSSIPSLAHNARENQVTSSCAFDLEHHSFEVVRTVHGLQRRDQILAAHAADPTYVSKMPAEQLTEDLVVMAEAWDGAAWPTLSFEEIKVIAAQFGKIPPEDVKFRDNRNFVQTNWIRKELYYRRTNVLTLLGDELINREISWAERVRIFKKYIRDPRVVTNKFTSVYALDPLLGLDSLKFTRIERSEASEIQIDSSIDGQRKGVGYLAFSLWSQYPHMNLLFANGEIHDGQTIVDIGSGIGRVALYVAAMYPQAHFLGFEYMPERMAFAQKVIKRFGLESRIQFRNVNLENEDLPLADHYFFFNSLSPKPYERMLQVLRRNARQHPFYFYSMFDPQKGLKDLNGLKTIFSTQLPLSRPDVDPVTGAVKMTANSGWVAEVFCSEAGTD